MTDTAEAQYNAMEAENKAKEANLQAIIANLKKEINTVCKYQFINYYVIITTLSFSGMCDSQIALQYIIFPTMHFGHSDKMGIRTV